MLPAVMYTSHRRRLSCAGPNSKESGMTEINDKTRPGRDVINARPGSRKAPLIGVAALLVTLTNAVIFVLPPLLPLMAAQYGLATVSETTWIYTAFTLAGGAGYILL